MFNIIIKIMAREVDISIDLGPTGAGLVAILFVQLVNSNGTLNDLEVKWQKHIK